MKTTINQLSILMLIAALFLFSACKNEDDPDPIDEPAMINLSSGEYLVDGDNRTLYIFTRDVSGLSNCSGGCVNSWPAFYEEDLNFGAGVNASDFAEITLTGGSKQITYKGWPLYYYSSSGDGILESPGSTTGDAVNGVWFTAKDYSVALANAQLVGNDGNNYKDDFQPGDGMSQFLVDGEGNTIYIFKNDYKDQNNFTKSDFSNDASWPIFYEEIENLPSLLSAADFGEIDVFGEKQLTYKGWPLYHFGQDAKRGDTKGVSVPSPGVWPIVNLNTVDALDVPTVLIRDDASFGNILTDNQGQSLYFFARDADGTNHCTGGCALKWPVFYTEEIILKSGSSLSVSDFNSITLADGTSKQTTYKGWPLYHYAPAGDEVIEAPGATSGDGVGTVWFIAKPDYDLMTADFQLLGNNGKNYKSDYTEGDGNTKYFVDAMGRTLYLFVNDAKDTNNFTNEDFSNNGNWPIFYTEIANLPSAMVMEDFGEIMVHGQKQLTFKGWPVYYFGQDVSRGQNKGVSVPSPGVWLIMNNTTEPAM